MLLWLTLLGLWNGAICNRYEAADAIQHAIFGEDSGTIEATDSPGEDSATASASAMASGAMDEATAASQTQASSRSTTRAGTSGAQSAHLMMATSHAMSHATTRPQRAQNAQSSRRRSSAAYSASRRRRSSAAYLVHRPRTEHAAQPTITPFRQGQKWSGKSYSFSELSQMNVKSAPSQQGKFYRPRVFESVPVVEPCQAVKCHLSMAVMMDSSGSVGAENYKKELGFVKTLLQILAVKAEDVNLKVCVGLISYSTDVHVEVDPCCENSICRIIDQFSDRRRLVYRDGSTNTNGALKVARQMLQGPASFKKVALLITDGKSNTGGSPVDFARSMREQDGIQIVALGVTSDINEFELRGISGHDTVTKIDQFDEFHELANLLLQANKVASNQNIDFMCRRDKSTYKDTCERVMTEEQKAQCVLGEWSNCVRKEDKCFKTQTCKLNGIIITKESLECKCPPCPAGEEEVAGSSACVLCSAGTYKPDDTGVCLLCPEGTVSDSGATKCYTEFDLVDSSGQSVVGAGEGILLYKAGTVCDDYFSNLAAAALCRKMNRPYSEASFRNGLIGWALQSKMEIKMDDVRCQSDVWSECTFSEIDNCSHSEDVILTCRGEIETFTSDPAVVTKKASEDLTTTLSTPPYY